jgi:ribosomal-protein-alanine N-acetyltransferase
MLETDRLLLRRFRANDVEAVYAMRSDADLMRFIRPAQTDRSESESWISLVSSRWDAERLGFCAVIEKASGEFAGWCGLWRLKETQEVEVGYALRAEFRGRGYAHEASEAFLIYGFENLGLQEIVAVARPENRNSRRVMENLGMTYDYIGRFYDHDLVHYSISRTEFERRQRHRFDDRRLSGESYAG